jgi:predicted dehydrogenase/threonine dehydrogenase-like Zn-dependent dehydrogenase
MLVEFGRANVINKARQQPEKVRMVLDKIRTDGLTATLDTVQSKLDQPLPLGYCNVGLILQGADSQFQAGDRVASNGCHAEFASVPINLCAGIPDNVSDEEAAFAVVGAIALQGVRLANPTLGEAFVVTGLGLIGLIAVQLLRANGCRVLGIDHDSSRLELARLVGAETVDLSRGEDPVSASQAFTRGQGVDGVLITAATESSEPVRHAALMCRKRGRIVLVGVTGLELSRDDFYKKELSFQVSCSYGPGRYDPEYEEKGHDYPLAYVRWTEQRNLAAVLDLMAAGALDVKPLISHRFPIEQATQAYELLAGKEPYLGILLTYKKNEDVESEPPESTVVLSKGLHPAHGGPGSPVVGFIGAGNYAGRVLIPAFKKAGAGLHCLASAGGVSGAHFGRKFGFSETTTDTSNLFESERINTIVVATRHDSHAGFVLRSLEAGKNVFVEKPLCLNLDELKEIEELYSKMTSRGRSPMVMVGFNRRFAPQVQKIKELLAGTRQPKSFIMTVNAGPIPSDHWTQDPALGGGRIIGEACHFIDLLRFLAGEPIVEHLAVYLQQNGPRDNAIFTLGFLDGSIGSIHYLANGHRSLPKERLEVFCGGRALRLDNFRKLKGYGWPGFRKMNLWRQDKGQGACTAAFLQAVREGKPSPIPFDEIAEVSRVTIELAAVEGNR